MPRLIAFDLDGTLVDSAPDLAWSVDAMLARLDLPPAGEVQVRAWIGNGMAMLVRRALTGAQWPEHDPPRFDEAVAAFMEAYASNLCQRSQLYPGVMAGLDALVSHGYRLACITNKPERFTRPLLEQLGIADRFEFVVGGDTFPRQKPDPQPLLECAAHFGVMPADCLMVGDSPADAKAARNAGFRLALVPYGYHGDGRVEALEPDIVINSLTELPDWLSRADQPMPA